MLSSPWSPAIGWLFINGIGIVGRQHHRRLGLRHRELCLVDRHWQRRHAHLLDPAADAAGWRALDQPLRRDHDTIRRRDRRHLPDPAPRPADVFLLARALSEHDALWPQWRSPLVWDFWAIVSYLLFSIVFFYVGLCPISRPCATAPAREPDRSFTAPSRSAGAARHGTGAPRDLAHDLSRARRADGHLRSLHRRARFRGEPYARLAGDHFPALLRGRRALLRLRDGPPPDHCLSAGGFSLQAIITVNHFDAMAKIILTGSIMMTYSYATEWFMAWYGGGSGSQPRRLSIHRRLRPALLDAPLLQLRPAAGPLVQAACAAAVPAFVDLGPDPRRHVARAHPHHLEYALARLHADAVAAVPSDRLGLGSPDRPLGLFVFMFSLLLSGWCRRSRCTRCAGSAGRRGSHELLLLAEFADPDALTAAARRTDGVGLPARRRFTPFPVEGLAEILDIKPSRIRWAMLLAGLAVAGFFYWLQWWSAVHDYPLNVGGRPLNSWPVFLLVPFEVGMLAAAIAGLIALFWRCGLPRLHHPVFEAAGFERASQDRFFLLAEALERARRHSCARSCSDAGALVGLGGKAVRLASSSSPRLALAGCKDQSMREQKRYDVFEPAALWPDGTEARPLPEGSSRVATSPARSSWQPSTGSDARRSCAAGRSATRSSARPATALPADGTA